MQQIEITPSSSPCSAKTPSKECSAIPCTAATSDMVGWQLVGFPGPRMSNYDEVEKYYGEAFRPKPVSLEQVIGRKVRPSEDEDRNHENSSLR